MVCVHSVDFGCVKASSVGIHTYWPMAFQELRGWYFAVPADPEEVLDPGARYRRGLDSRVIAVQILSVATISYGWLPKLWSLFRSLV